MLPATLAEYLLLPNATRLTDRGATNRIAGVMEIPWWLTALGGTFAAVFAIAAFITQGASGEFVALAFIAGIFWAASLMKTSIVRNIITRIGTWGAS